MDIILENESFTLELGSIIWLFLAHTILHMFSSINVVIWCD